MKFILALCLLFGIGHLHAAGSASTSDSKAAQTDKTWAEVNNAIDAKDYFGAIKLLNDMLDVDEADADAWNFLGYSYRKLEDYQRSADAYMRALEIEPDHKGALEYQGELFLVLGKRDDAENNLAKLKVLCPTGCEEFEDLNEALNAQGN